MNRRTFTKNMADLILEMIYSGEMPIIDYVLRSAEEQSRLFKAGLSKCDGYNKKSAHQSALAFDMYLVKEIDGTPHIQFDWDRDKAIKWHNRWSEMGGRPMIEWDMGHFDGREIVKG